MIYYIYDMHYIEHNYNSNSKDKSIYLCCGSYIKHRPHVHTIISKLHIYWGPDIFITLIYLSNDNAGLWDAYGNKSLTRHLGHKDLEIKKRYVYKQFIFPTV